MKILIRLALIALSFFILKTGHAANYPFDVQISGKGKQAIIFIPGFACSGKVWDDTKTIFEKDFTCYTLTMPGFAGVPAAADPSFHNWEVAVANFIKDKKLDHPIIIGHSMGGGMALALAADYPQSIGKIVVVDALPCLAALRNPAFQSKENNDCAPIVSQMTNMTDSQFHFMQIMSMSRLVADTAKRATVIDWSMKSDRNTFALMYCDFSNTDLREKIKTVQCPALILLEPQFKTISASIEAQYKNLSTAQFKYADKGLHFIQYDDKEWYLQQLSAFVQPTKK